jgi:4-hydroxy-3-polyprenylbenzoate decarboxylase
MWSLAYRSNPIEDVHVEPHRSTGHAPKSGPGELDSTLLIDATLKYPMPPLALPGRKFMERAQVLWKELGLPAIAAHSPWHGYSLGDWTESWEQFARNAVAGAWAKNGDDTWARRRRNLTPETPVRMAEASTKPNK